MNTSDHPLETGEAFKSKINAASFSKGELRDLLRRDVPGPFLHSHGLWTVVGWTQGDHLSYRWLGPNKVWSPVAQVGGASYAGRAVGVVNDSGKMALVWTDAQSFELKGSLVSSPTLAGKP